MNQLEEIKARAEVNQYVGKTASQDEAKATLKVIAALEAVEAHHQPIPAGAYDGSRIQICATCSDDTGNWEIYPCPTLTVIKEALQ